MAQETSANFGQGSVIVGFDSRTCDASLRGALRYHSANGCLEACGGVEWRCTTTPAVGYLVQTATKWNGNLGGLSGADGKCLTELQTTYDWNGKADAGTLTAARVKALLCDGTTCNNLQPDTVYLTAKANDTAKGGQGFKTDATGAGPGSSWTWDQDNFSGASNTWTNRGGASGDSWLTTPQGTSHCTNWTSSSSGQSGREGNAGWGDYRRWNEATDTCNVQNFLLCFVNP